jgi:hypothetical protein
MKRWGCQADLDVSFQTIASPALREPAPFVFFVRAFTVANVDSTGLVVRKWS